MADAKRDNNYVTTLIAVSNVDGSTPVILYADPSTHRLLVQNSTTALRAATIIVAASNSKDTNADYVCDGTADDVQINAALAALPSEGGTVLLMEGTYNLTARLDMGISNSVLRGSGKGTLLNLVAGSNCDVISMGDFVEVAPLTDMTVQDLTIEGNMASQTSGNNGGIWVPSSTTRFTIQGCRIKNSRAYNIFVDGAPYGLIKDNYLDTTRATIDYSNIEGGGNYLRIINNVAISGDYAGFSIYTGSVGRVIIDGNTIITPTGYGIEIQVAEAVVRNNHIQSPGSTSVFVHNNDATVTGNNIFIDNNPSTGYVFRASSSQTTFSNNLVQIDTGNSAALTVFSIAADQCVVSGNLCYFNTVQAHIGIANGNSYNNIVGNTFYDIRSSITAMSMTNAQYLSCGNNVMIGCSIGIDATGVNFSSIYSNVITSTLNAAIILTNARENTISNNAIDSADYGIYIANTTTATRKRLIITGNYIDSINKEGMFLQGLTYSIVTNNKITSVGAGANNTYAGIFITSTGTAYSVYNVISGNAVESTNGSNNFQKYGIRENTANDGPNIITNNICLNAGTTQISAQHVSSDVSHNITT